MNQQTKQQLNAYLTELNEILGETPIVKGYYSYFVIMNLKNAIECEDLDFAVSAGRMLKMNAYLEFNEHPEIVKPLEDLGLKIFNQFF